MNQILAVENKKKEKVKTKKIRRGRPIEIKGIVVCLDLHLQDKAHMPYIEM